jgi:hypothetical protein
MKPTDSVLPVRWTTTLCILAGIYAVAVAVYLFNETPKPSSASDFHAYWYAGHFLIQRHDPYQAYINGGQPSLPVSYWDSVITRRYPIAQPGLALAPAYTPAVLFPLTLFSHLSWPTAKWSFWLLNLVLMLLSGWLVLRRVPFGGIHLVRLDELLILLLYFDLSATRIAIENGQITLFIFTLMLVTLLTADFAWPVAGLALGFALSKYSLALPLFLFMLYKKKYRVIFLAILIQLLGMLGLAALTRQSPVSIVSENIQLFLQHFDQPGIQISRWFEFLLPNRFASLLPALLMTVLVFLPLFFWLRKDDRTTTWQREIVDFHLLTILFIWTLLLGYHRLYDTLILVFFIVLVFKGSVAPGIWDFAAREQTVLWTFMLLLPPFLILPARIVDLLLPFYYGRVSDFITTLLLVIMLAISMFLLWRYLQIMQFKITPKETESNEL